MRRIAARAVWCLAAAPAVAPAQTDHREPGQPVQLTVSAASSLTDAFETITHRFTTRHPNITVRLNFGGSNHLQRQIEELKSQLEAEQTKNKKPLSLKVSQKGGVSLYGIRRFPITFYLEEWRRILDMEGEIRNFLSEHEAELRKKN